MPKLRFLHISDFHAGGSLEKEGQIRELESVDRELVFGRKWTSFLKGIGEINYILFTGDLAFGGKDDEYEDVTIFLKKTCEILNLEFDAVFTVPGNHDINRNASKGSWKKVKALIESGEMDEEAVSKWMAEKYPQNLTDKMRTLRTEIRKRSLSYNNWVENSLGRPELLPENNKHGTLGYSVSIPVSDGPPVHIIGLDSSWLCGQKNEKGELMLTRHQVQRLTKIEEPGLSIALMHHSLADLDDREDMSEILADNFHMFLRGHLHKTKSSTLRDPDSTLRELAVGCLYAGSKWRNGVQVIALDWNHDRCLGKSKFYAWNGRDWLLEILYRNTNANGELEWDIDLEPDKKKDLT